MSVIGGTEGWVNRDGPDELRQGFPMCSCANYQRDGKCEHIPEQDSQDS